MCRKERLRQERLRNSLKKTKAENDSGHMDFFHVPCVYFRSVKKMAGNVVLYI